MNSDQFVNAIAPKGDLSKIGRAQFATLFRVADANKRGLVSWDDFVVFETILKRPDADYWIAFQYFDVYAHPSDPPRASNVMQTKPSLIFACCVAETSRALSRMMSSRTC